LAKPGNSGAKNGSFRTLKIKQRFSVRGDWNIGKVERFIRKDGAKHQEDGTIKSSTTLRFKEFHTGPEWVRAHAGGGWKQ